MVNVLKGFEENQRLCGVGFGGEVCTAQSFLEKTNRSLDLTCQESLGSQKQTPPTLNVSADSDVVPTAPQADHLPMELAPIPLEKVCGSFDSQTDCEVLFDLAMNNDVAWTSYHESLSANTELASHRSVGLENIFHVCGVFGSGLQTIVAAVQYFDTVLSKTVVESSMPRVEPLLWSVACARMAIKVVDGLDYIISDWAMFFPLQSDYSKCEMDLAALLKWKLCLPTIYTLFHCLKQKLNLGSLDGSIDEQHRAEGYSNDLIELILRDPRFLKFPPYVIVASMVCVVYSLPEIPMQFFQEETLKRRVKECHTFLLECIKK